MGLTVERTLWVQDARNLRSFAVAASTVIYRGEIVALDTAAPTDQGLARPMADVATDVCVGIAIATVDNSEGAAGAKDVVCITSGVVRLPSGLVIPKNGEAAYWAAGSLVNSTGNAVVGKTIRQTNDGSRDVWVELRPIAL